MPIPEIKGHALCPVNAYHDMVTTIPASPDQPLLLIPLPPGKLTTLTTRTLALLFKEILDTLGYNPNDFTLHCLRRGGTHQLIKQGQIIYRSRDMVHGPAITSEDTSPLETYSHPRSPADCIIMSQTYFKNYFQQLYLSAKCHHMSYIS